MTLPALSAVQTKTKVMKSSLSAQPTNVPTNLIASMVQQENSTTTTTTTTNSSKSSENATLSSSIPNEPAVTVNNNNSWMYCSEIPITARPQLPSLPHQKNQTKTSIGRQVTSVVKRHTYRQQIYTDKII